MLYTEEEVKNIRFTLNRYNSFYENGKQTTLGIQNSNFFQSDFLFGLILYMGYFKQEAYLERAKALENLIVQLVDKTALVITNENESTGLTPLELAKLMNNNKITQSIEQKLSKTTTKQKTFILG